MRLGTLVALLLLVSACKHAPLGPAELVLSGTPSGQVDLGEGQTAFYFGPVPLDSRLREAPGVVLLHLEGVTVAPASEAELYLADEKLTGFDPTHYVGSVATLAQSPTAFPSLTHEVNDFEAAGQRFTARTTLRARSAFALALVVKRGRVEVERFVLTTAPGTAPRACSRCSLQPHGDPLARDRRGQAKTCIPCAG